MDNGATAATELEPVESDEYAAPDEMDKNAAGDMAETEPDEEQSVVVVESFGDLIHIDDREPYTYYCTALKATVYLRPVSASQAESLDANRQKWLVENELQARVVAFALCNSEGKPIAGEKHIQALGTKSFLVLQELFDKVAEDNNLKENQNEKAEKN